MNCSAYCIAYQHIAKGTHCGHGNQVIVDLPHSCIHIMSTPPSSPCFPLKKGLKAPILLLTPIYV